MAERPPTPRPRPRAAAALLAALVTAAGCGGGAPVQGPAFATRTARVDLGELWEGEVRETTFRLDSIGTEPIVVEQRLDSCGCTATEWFEVDRAGARTPYAAGEPVEPGHALELTVRFDSRGRSGPFDQPISLYGRFAGGKIELRIAARIRPLVVVEGFEGVEASPEAALAVAGAAVAGDANARAGRFLDLGRVRAGAGASARARLRSNAGPVALRLEVGSVDDLVGELEPIEPGPDGRAERWLLTVRLPAEAPAGVRAGSLVLSSDTVDASGAPVTCEVHVAVQVRGVVEALMPLLTFDVLDAGEERERSTTLVVEPRSVESRLPPAQELVVRAALEAPEGEVDASAWFAARFEPAGPGGPGRVVIRAGPLPEGPFGPVQGVVELPLGLPEQGVLRVHFTATATGLAARR